jgi:hypothetical protein
MTKRDNFSRQTKQYVALRAGHQCSFTGCSQRTVGPSSESPTAITNVGDAAHICAAAPGGRRYVESMTPEERSHIDNAIWCCALHARLIDRDETVYTIGALRQMKRDREAASAEEVRRRASHSTRAHDLIAIGPDIVCMGELLGVDAREWSLDVSQFVSGDFSTILSFNDRFDDLRRSDRYILVNALGDGRVLEGRLSATRQGVSFLLRGHVEPGFPRITADQLGSQWATHSETGDLYAENSQIARVSGLKSLPQSLRQSLSLHRGESPFYPECGVRIAEYYSVFRETPWFEHFLKLEVIRQSSIPYFDTLQKREYLPLRCVERVWGVEILAEAPVNSRLPIRLDLEVKGTGRWQCDISIHVANPVLPCPKQHAARS